MVFMEGRTNGGLIPAASSGTITTLGALAVGVAGYGGTVGTSGLKRTSTNSRTLSMTIG